jgi:putative sterol carrier protein
MRMKPNRATANPRADTFINLADGKLNGQKAFMTGALKVKGNVSGPWVAWRGAARRRL